MWVMTPFGFFSIVCGRTLAGGVDDSVRMIRARKHAHLAELRKRHPALPEIVRTDNTDYPYRIITTNLDVVREIMLFLVDNLDYNNFKSEAHRASPHDHEYHEFLTSVWTAGLRITPPAVRSVRPVHYRPEFYEPRATIIETPELVELPGGIEFKAPLDGGEVNQYSQTASKGKKKKKTKKTKKKVKRPDNLYPHENWHMRTLKA